MDKNELEQTVDVAEPTSPEPIRGRKAAIKRWMEANPDFEGDPQDDDLYDYTIGQSDEWKSKYDKQNEVNSALANRISEDPRLGALIAGLMDTDEAGNKRNPAYVLAKLYGKDFLEDDEALKSLNDGYAEYLEGVKRTEEEGRKAQENFLESMSKVDAYANREGLSDEKVEELRQALVQAADDMINGKFSDDFIATVAKGLSYDADVQEAADTGFVEGKNEKVSMKFGKSEGDMPAMGTTTNSPRTVKTKEPERKSFFDEMKPV